MFDLKLFDLLRGKSPEQVARISAYLLAPLLVIGITISEVAGNSFGIDLNRPFTVSPLVTEVSADGKTTGKRGVALIVEPVTSEFRLQLESSAPHYWSTFDDATARANNQRLRVDENGLSAQTPFLGVDGPVAIVMEGRLGEQIQMPGATVGTDNWGLPSRRSTSIVTSVLLACVFAFGISLSNGFPAIEGNNHTAREVRTKPHK